jgi:hypothetical protein
MTKKPFEYYLDLIRNGEVLTDIEISNAKSLHKRGCNKDYESCLAVVRRNREENDNWNDWYYRRFVLTHEALETRNESIREAILDIATELEAL